MKKKLLLVGFIFILLAAIPLTLSLLQKQQKTKTQAAPSTTIEGKSPTSPVSIGQEFSLDIAIKPGSNIVSYIKLNITYDATKLATSGAGFEPNSTILPAILDGPTYTPGNITVALSTGPESTSVIQSNVNIGKITFKGIATTGETPTQVTFNGSQVLSIASSDLPSENVLQTTSPASITINPGTTTPGPTTANQLPICSSLSIDRPLTGVAPYSITFTGTGTDPDGTINSATFYFGDGPIQNVTQAGGIGTNMVSVPISHTYNNAGTFTAKITLTDNSKGTSVENASCSKTIVVTSPIAVTTQPGQITAIPTQIVITTTIPTNIPTRGPIPSSTGPGPGNIIVGMGIGGFIISAIGVILLLSLI